MIFENIIRATRQSVSEQKGAGEILSFIVISPILTWFFVYLVLGGAFQLKIDDMSTIVNKKLDLALVEGQFTTNLQNDLVNELAAEGFEQSYLEIETTQSEAYDGDNSTYVLRGNELEIKVVYKKPHAWYYVNLGAGSESKFYIGTKLSGASEKW